MQPALLTLEPKKLVGQSIRNTIARDRTFELWRNFMPRRKEIPGRVSEELFSMQVYHPFLDYASFRMDTEFEKWAAVEVSDYSLIPEGMEPFDLPGGLYAVFHYTGLPSEFAATYHYIFGTWIPQSGFMVDSRPHFEILGPKYKHDSPESEEDVWVPVRR